MARKTIVDWHRRRLLRQHIPGGESAAALLVGAGLLALVWWVLAQRDAYDPSERDLPVALQSAERPKIEIYNVPLKRWVEPGTATAGGPAPLALAPFPPTLVDGEWALAARVRHFDPTNLYEKINGEAEKFIKQGLRTMHYATLKARDGTELAIELYDQGGVGGSLGIFSGHRPAGREVTERAGVSFFPTAVGVIGRVGPYFFRAAADRESDAVKIKSLALVEALSALVNSAPVAAAPASAAAVVPSAPAAEANTPSSATAPQAMQLLASTLGLKESDLAFQAANVFQFDFAEAFWFGSLADGGRAFLHAAQDPAAAAALYDMLLEELMYDHDMLDQQEGRVILKHKFLNTYMALARIGSHIAGAENLPAQAQAEPILRKLSAALAR